MHRLRPLLSILLAGAACLGAAHAQPADPPPHEPGGRGGPYGRLFISPAGEPFRGGPGEPPMATWFRGADKNADGALTPDELVADHLRFFALLDVDHNGAIEGAEVTRYEHEIVPEILSQIERGGDRGDSGPPSGRWEGRGRGGHGGGRGGRGGHGGPRGGGGPGLGADEWREGAARFSLLKEAEPVRAADANLDFRVSLDEWRAAALSRFRRLDANGDGKLDLAELQAQAPMRRGGRGGRPREGVGDDGGGPGPEDGPPL
jgi:hypothetical protein